MCIRDRLLTLLIMTPLTFVVLAPAMGIISIYLGNALLWVYNTFGMFAIAIMCIIYPWMVVTCLLYTSFQNKLILSVVFLYK